MTYSYVHKSRKAAHEAGRLCCCVCLLDLGPADDPYRDPDCPRCLQREYEQDAALTENDYPDFGGAQ